MAPEEKFFPSNEARKQANSILGFLGQVLTIITFVVLVQLPLLVSRQRA
jgi:hypothetical protein